ncbi:MlaA family lipoprotein [Phaeovulum vinaykumarii]|uniref:Phospholipid-binding lipoprotein MlaA n=1 Tax=Phaeovulum vinaykumarii TaxID=407234 RepID=A0A1N7L4C8_9RHOB|nr:VacJ family lipoprotein [Phaeovulum vinaykumarii]SIS68674.1 phospholipid-binding lipoprotein MlaA [Phaeovulum vinaykumarii]SOB99925.1 phospholipid-binding lipoprotein MlaA [Phaeovulum vinaykumarii]
MKSTSPSALQPAGHPLRAAVAALALGTALAGCAADPATRAANMAAGIDDPLEPTNRTMHAFNTHLDRAAVRPAAQIYGTVTPEPGRIAVSNLAQNLRNPGNAVNRLLQGDLDAAGRATLRFAVNTLFGLGGLIDAGQDFGLPASDTDFGETLAVWGAGEGSYLELPVLGPTTMRGAVGKVVDLALDPVGRVAEAPNTGRILAVKVADKLNARYRFTATVDGLLYDSADSYAQTRLLYLQNRRHEIGDKAAADAAAIDPYEDPYAQ